MDEIFEIVDDNNNIIGRTARSQCHGNPELCHRTAHVIVLNKSGDILLQKRAKDKDIQPGKWDTAVGGHLMMGETFEQAAIREMNEELGIPSVQPISLLFNMKIRNEIESENVAVFSTVYSGPFTIQKSEIDEVRFWPLCELINICRDVAYSVSIEEIFTPNCILEIEKYLKNI